MNIIIEEVVSEFPIEILEEVVQINISDAVSYFDIIEVGDTDFVGKDGFVPVVDEATGKFVLQEQQSSSGGVPEAPNNANAYVRQALSWVVGYTKTAIDNLLGNKFNNPIGNNTQYLDGAGVPTIFPTIPSPQNLEQVTAEGAETTTPILVKNEDNSRAIEYRSDGFAILADAGNKAILFEAETPTGISGTGKAVLKDVGDDVKTIAYIDDIPVINENYKGTYTALSALNTAHPTAVAGNYAIVDGGIGVEPIQYLWDGDDNEWVAGSSSSPVTTDALTEGTVNLYFTNARAVAALASALASKLGLPQTLRVGSNITLTSTTASQKLFGNLGPNGDGSLPVEVGRYKMEMIVTLTSLANSGSIGFVTGIGDGTSVFSNIMMGVFAFKAGLTGSGAGTFTRMTSFTSNPAISGTGTNTNGFIHLSGEFSVTTAGKFFPGISLNVSATPENNSGSFCTITKID